jgi:hypothetical protein
VRITRTICLTPLIAGCYSYSAITPAAAPAGIEVRARITGAASDRVGPQIGSLEQRELIGNVVDNRNGELILDVEGSTRPNVATSAGPLRARVQLAPSDLVSLEQRKLDRGRTTLLTAAIIAGVGAGVAVALHAGGGAEEGKGPPEPPPINRIPVLRFRF